MCVCVFDLCICVSELFVLCMCVVCMLALFMLLSIFDVEHSTDVVLCYCFSVLIFRNCESDIATWCDGVV